MKKYHFYVVGRWPDGRTFGISVVGHKAKRLAVKRMYRGKSGALFVTATKQYGYGIPHTQFRRMLRRIGVVS